MRAVRPGLRESDIAAVVAEAAFKHNYELSFPIIATVNGQTLHNHAGYSNAITDSARISYKIANEGSIKAYKQLLAEGIKDLYYISHEDLNFDPDMPV